MTVREDSAYMVKHHDVHPYEQPVELPFVLPTRFYTGMLVVWLLRPALQKRFPLHRQNSETYLTFLAWCTSIGRRQYPLLREIDAWNQELMQPIKMPAVKRCPWEESYTVGMYLAGLSRSKYWHGQILANVKMRHRAARWYFREGRQLMGLADCPEWQLLALQQAFTSADAFTQQLILPKDAALPDGEARIRANIDDICSRWGKHEEKNEENGTEDVAVIRHSHVTAVTKTVMPNESTAISQGIAAWLPIEVNEISWLINELKKRQPGRGPSQRDITRLMATLSTPVARPKTHITKPFGVNLVGYARGELGIGEDVRMVAASLEKAGVPFHVINVEPGANVSQRDTSAEKWLAESFDYAFTIFCMTGIEMTRMTLEKGLSWLEGHYNIGLWPWELPEWPHAWHHAWHLVDELWGISHYTANAYAAAPVPVKPMPLPVALNADNIPSDREQWQLPQGAYLFVFSFDMNSTLARKNPIAAVKAFLEAFAHQPDQHVGLVIKVSHLNRKHPAWKPLSALIKKDPRIHLISGELRKAEVLSLYKSCDCFVSLHRAEGFGRGLAEAQLLGLDLITTGFSGNMAFCEGNNTHLVDYHLVPVKPGEYFYGEGQQWAEPDTHQAARLMCECAALGTPRQTAVPHAVEQFSPDYCGHAYRARLEAIASKVTHST